jgi:site-specific DNA-methyltransferase (adenine-specific)
MSIADVLSGQARWAIVEGDAMALLSSLPENSVDAVVTSPPYNAGASPSAYEHPGSSRGQGKDWQGYEGDRDALPEPEYQAEQIASLQTIARVMKPGASFFYVHKDRLWDGRLISPLEWLLKQDALVVRQQIIWDRGTTHRMDGWYFNPVHEYIFWLTKGPLRRRNLGAAKMWGSIWRIDQPQRYIVPWHPCPFPVALATRCITALTEPNDLVIDPYAGANSTGVAALETGRRYLGFERQPLYVANSRTRLSAYTRPLALEAA